MVLFKDLRASGRLDSVVGVFMGTKETLKLEDVCSGRVAKSVQYGKNIHRLNITSSQNSNQRRNRINNSFSTI